MRVGDLAEIFAERHKKTIKVIGLRPGEKRHEDLINESESTRTREFTGPNGLTHYVIGPAFKAGDGSRFTYSSSDDVMDKESLKLFLNSLGIIEASLEQFKGRVIEEIPTNRKE